jgi:cysteinyl-tRNA synthetase
MDSGEFRAGNLPSALELLDEFDKIFAVLAPSDAKSGMTDAEAEQLVAERGQAKKNRDFSLADQIRRDLLEAGIILEDTKEGTRWKRK